MILVLLIAAKVSGQFLQLRGWHAVNFVPHEIGQRSCGSL